MAVCESGRRSSGGSTRGVVGLLWMCLVACFTAVSAEECSTVAVPYVACEENGVMSVSPTCPPDYIIQLVSASYLVSDGSTCPTPSTSTSTHCIVNAKLAGFSMCHNVPSCTHTVPRYNSAACSGGGVHYIRLLYNCEPRYVDASTLKAGSIAISGNTPMSEKQVVHISSHHGSLTETVVTTDDTTYVCIVTIPDNAEVDFQLESLIKSPQHPGCNQRIQIWDGAQYVKTLCEPSDPGVTLSGCNTEETTFFIRYLNSEPDVRASFKLSVRVSHLVSGFNMQCGLKAEFLPAAVHPPSAAPSSTTPSTKLNPELIDKTSQSVVEAAKERNKILDFVAVFVLVPVALIIVIAVLAVRYRRKHQRKEETEPEDWTYGKPGFSILGNIYLDGEQRSKLVLDRRRSSVGMDTVMDMRKMSGASSELPTYAETEYDNKAMMDRRRSSTIMDYPRRDSGPLVDSFI